MSRVDQSDSTVTPNRQEQFNTTHWSVVLAAGREASEGAQAALEKLCGAYWYPLYAFVRRKGHDAEEAKDLTQSFFARLLQGNRLAFADPARGRFRTFLLSSLQNFLINEWTKTRREKRGGQVEFIPLHGDEPEKLYAVESAEARTPETLFEQRWAAAVMARAFDRLRAEYGGGRAELFATLKPFVWGEKSATPPAEAAAALGMTEGAVRVAVHRLRKRYGALLRTEIADTVGSETEVADELRHLITIVSRGSL